MSRLISIERSSPAIIELPARLTAQYTRLSVRDFRLLRLKQRRLLDPHSQTHEFVERHIQAPRSSGDLVAEAVQATFVFGQEEAGTAICISADGVLLTCSHCIGESRNAALGRRMWLVSATGRIVEAACVAWDGIRDLALMEIVAADTKSAWPYIGIEAMAVKQSARLLCVGHPGSEDLETSQPGVATGYEVLHISEGRYRGLAEEQNVQDNSEIGALKHDCWTYWGHSGAPLIERASGRLAGLHSSWDDETGMRRGVALEAVLAFLQEHKANCGAEDLPDSRDGTADNPLRID